MFDVEPHSPNSDIKQLCSTKCGVVLLAKKATTPSPPYGAGCRQADYVTILFI